MHGLTSVDIFVNAGLLSALVGSSVGLGLQSGACSSSSVVASVHCVLECVSLPSENVIGVLSIAIAKRKKDQTKTSDIKVLFLRITHAVDEWLCLAIGSPQLVEGACIPDCLKEELWDFDWVSGWALSGSPVGCVALMELLI